MVIVKIKGTTCCLYNVYTVVTMSHGITAMTIGSYTTARAVIYVTIDYVGYHLRQNKDIVSLRIQIIKIIIIMFS